MNELSDWLAFPGLLGGIGMAIFALFKGASLWRSGTRTKERDAIEEQRRWHQALVDRAERAERQMEWKDRIIDWLRSRIGDLEYVIRRDLGPDAVPEPRNPYPVRPAELEREEVVVDDGTAS